MCVTQTDLTAVEECTDRLLLLVQKEDMSTTWFHLNLVLGKVHWVHLIFVRIGNN